MTTMTEREAAREVSGLWSVFLVTGILRFVVAMIVLRFTERSREYNSLCGIGEIVLAFRIRAEHQQLSA